MDYGQAGQELWLRMKYKCEGGCGRPAESRIDPPDSHSGPSLVFCKDYYTTGKCEPSEPSNPRMCDYCTKAVATLVGTPYSTERHACVNCTTPYGATVWKPIQENPKKHDPVNNPSHYTHSAVETIDAIEAWGLGFHLGNAVKYISRAGHKQPDKSQDIRKAIWYLERYLKHMGDQ